MANPASVTTEMQVDWLDVYHSPSRWRHPPFPLQATLQISFLIGAYTERDFLYLYTWFLISYLIPPRFFPPSPFCAVINADMKHQDWIWETLRYRHRHTCHSPLPVSLSSRLCVSICIWYLLAELFSFRCHCNLALSFPQLFAYRYHMAFSALAYDVLWISASQDLG